MIPDISSLELLLLHEFASVVFLCLNGKLFRLEFWHVCDFFLNAKILRWLDTLIFLHQAGLVELDDADHRFVLYLRVVIDDHIETTLHSTDSAALQVLDTW